jgi:hypothetical protein
VIRSYMYQLDELFVKVKYLPDSKLRSGMTFKLPLLAAVVKDFFTTEQSCLAWFLLLNREVLLDSCPKLRGFIAGVKHWESV